MTVLVVSVNFNPRTREGCDKFGETQMNKRIKFQSTHPRRVRPVNNYLAYFSNEISIHAPAKGATLLVASLGICYQDFNPRTREGCDLTVDSTIDELNEISIHAPAKGATRQVKKYQTLTFYFNPRTREGCDQSPRFP